MLLRFSYQVDPSQKTKALNEIEQTIKVHLNENHVIPWFNVRPQKAYIVKVFSFVLFIFLQLLLFFSLRFIDTSSLFVYFLIINRENHSLRIYPYILPGTIGYFNPSYLFLFFLLSLR